MVKNRIPASSGSRLPALLAGGTVLIASFAVLAQPAAPIKIGAVISATGGIAGVGLPEREGILLAQKIINQQGGINGRPLQLFDEDDGSNPDSTVNKANALLKGEKVKVLLGPSNIAGTLAVGGITDVTKVPTVAFTGFSTAEVNRKCVFHMLPPQELNARGLLAYAQQSLKVKRVGILHDSGYGQVIVNSLRPIASQYGIELVQVEKFEISATDTSAQAAKVKAANPEALFIIGTTATPFRNVRQLRINLPIVATLGSSAYQYVKAMGEAADNIIFPEFVVAEDPLPHQKEFIAMFQKEYGRLPKNYEAAGWDGVQLVAQALKAVGPDASNEQICAAIRKAPYQGVMGTYDFNAADMTGLKVTSFNYSSLSRGRFTRLPFKAKE